MPAMAPPDKPDPELAAAAPAPVDVALGATVVVDVNRGGIDVVVGSRTFWQRDSTSALTQHESVELGELVAQKAQSPCKLDW